MKKALLALSFLTGSLIFTNTAKAQLGAATPTGTFTVKISEVLDLAVTSGASNTFDFNSIAKIDAGIETLNAVTLTYKSNKPWFVNVSANSANFTGSSPTPMPASVVQFRLNGNASYSTLSAVPASLSGTSAAKNARGTATIGVDYKVNPGYTYAPADDYGMVITYTISNL
jgi:spore coat protein U-like protein